MIQHGIYLTWQYISATIKDKQILNNISGYCSPGTTLAIMGPSGAGKTTLLSILAKKHGKGMKITGDVFANNSEYSSAQFYNFGSFVFQNDILNEALTVKQTLQFSAKLKLKDQAEANERVQELINNFNLHKCQNTYIGGKIIKGISGGEKKRVCIAVQMVSKPDLLILDEPTSGLDSYMAYNIIQVFTRMAKKEGKTIIFTIHQPSFRIFSLLDHLLLLDKGQCIYQGIAGGILQYMLSLNITIPAKTTICDYFMFQISQYKTRTQNYASKLNSISYGQNISQRIQKQIKQVKQICPDGYSKIKATHSYLEQLLILLKRQVKLFTRNPMKFGRAIGNALLTIIIVGLIFINAISDNRPVTGEVYLPFQILTYFISAQGTAFISITSVIMSGIFSVALVFPIERQVFSKQIASKTYSTFPYFISKLAIQVMSLIICIIIFATGVFWLQGYTFNFVHFLKFVLVLCSVAFVGNSIGLFTGSLFKDAQRSSAMAPALILPLMMFAGLYNKLDSIPKWISWMQYISPFRYGLHALLLTQYQDEKYQLMSGEFYDYKESLAINLSYGENIGLLLGIAGLYYSLAYILLRTLTSRVSA